MLIAEKNTMMNCPLMTVVTVEALIVEVVIVVMMELVMAVIMMEVTAVVKGDSFGDDVKDDNF